MAELVERDWAMKEIEFWENRAKHYRDMIFDLMAKMLKGVKFDSVEWTADGITWKEKQSGWITVSEERLPEDLEEVNITFTNLEPEPYYDFIKGKRFTGAAVFYKGEWYWYSSITVDVLKEYGRYESEKIDEGIKIIAWQPLPEPYKGGDTE